MPVCLFVFLLFSFFFSPPSLSGTHCVVYIELEMVILHIIGKSSTTKTYS